MQNNFDVRASIVNIAKLVIVVITPYVYVDNCKIRKHFLGEPATNVAGKADETDVLIQSDSDPNQLPYFRTIKRKIADLTPTPEASEEKIMSLLKVNSNSILKSLIRVMK